MGWLGTISHDEWSDSVRPLAATTDDTSVYVSTKSKIYVFDRITLQPSNSFAIDTDESIVKIACDINLPGFVTVATKSSVFKYTIAGYQINDFTQPTPSDDPFVAIAYNDKFDALLVTSSRLYHVVDFPHTQTVRTTATDRHMWPQADIYIDRSESVVDFAYNSSIQKLWDNLALFRDSIQCRFVTYVDSVQDEFLLQKIEPITDNEIFELSTGSSRLVGINELVTSHVIERAFAELCVGMEGVLGMLEERFDRLPCEGDICWTWTALAGKDTPGGRTCDSNPITWFELQSFVPTQFSKQWKDAKGCGCIIRLPE